MHFFQALTEIIDMLGVLRWLGTAIETLQYRNVRGQKLTLIGLALCQEHQSSSPFAGPTGEIPWETLCAPAQTAPFYDTLG